MADIKEDTRTPEKPPVSPARPDAKPTAVLPTKKEVPIGFGVITPEMERYRSIITKDPNSRVFAALAELYRKAGMLEEAIKLCLKGTKVHPNYMSGHVALSRAYYDKGMIKESKEEILKVVSITPDNIVAHKILGDIFLSEGDVDKARESFTKAQTLSPDDVEVKEKLIEVDRGPRRPQAKEQEDEDILEGEDLEVVEEGATGEIVRDTDSLRGGGIAAAGAEEISLEGEDIDIPSDSDLTLEDDVSLDELVGDEPADRSVEDRGVAEAAPRRGLETIESEFGSGDIEETGTGEPTEEDQELVDEFGILEEGEGDISVEGLSEEAGRVPDSRTSPRETAAIGGVGRPESGNITLFGLQEDRREGADAPGIKGVTITTETIADIYVKQGYYDKALSVYEELIGASPTRDSLKQKIGFVRKKIKEMADEGHRGAPAISEEGPEAGVGAAPSGEGKRLERSIENLNRWLLNIRKYRRL